MPRKVEVNSKPIALRDPEAVLLVKRRAVKEGRSCSNSLAQTVIEHLKKETAGEGMDSYGTNEKTEKADSW